MADPRIAAQLIIFGDRTEGDVPGVLADVAAAGYDGFESGPPDPARFRPAMQERGLGYVGGHIGLDQLTDEDALGAVADGVTDLGGRFLMVSGRAPTLDAYREAARNLDRAGEICHGRGVTLCYHNHFWEFHELEGAVPIHLLTEETNPDLVKLCPDVYWVHVGGETPSDFLATYRDRVECVHLKDGLAGDQFREFRELGQGRIDIKSAVRAALACNPEWLIVEQDTTNRSPAQSLRISRDYLRDLGL